MFKRAAIAAVATLAALSGCTGTPAAKTPADLRPPVTATTPGGAAPGAPGAPATSSPPGSQGPSGAAADGRIADPRNATLDVPGWENGNADCVSGRLKFTNGQGPGRVKIAKWVDADVDGDGAGETVVLFTCGALSAAYGMAAGYDGARSLGVVVRSQLERTAKIQQVADLRAADKAVEVQVGDVVPFADIPADAAQLQWRAFAFGGGRFAQSGGPTAFPVNPNIVDLSVAAAADLSTVTVYNFGPVPARHGRLVLGVPADVTVTTPGGPCIPATLNSPKPKVLVCPLPTLPVGTSATIVLQVTAPTHGAATVAAESAPTLTSIPSYPEPTTDAYRNNLVSVEL